MKRTLKIVAIVAACVIGLFGIVVGVAFAIGDKDKTNTPTSIYFSSASVNTTDAFEMVLSTSTDNPSDIVISLRADRTGIIDFPDTVRLNEKFLVWPVKNNGTNVGGAVKLKAD